MKNQYFKASIGAAMLMLGCGRTVEGVDPIEGTGGAGDKVMGSGGAPPNGTATEGAGPCGALGLEPQAPLLVAGSGSDLWLVRADGERIPLDHGFGSELGPGAKVAIESVMIEGSHVLVSAQVGERITYLPPHELALFSSDGRRLWHYTPPSPGNSAIYDLLLGERGVVTFYESTLDAGEGSVILTPDGQRFWDAGSTPLSTPDAGGWMAVARRDPSAPAGELHSYGFLRPEDAGFVAARFQPLPGVPRPLTVIRGSGNSLLYVTKQGSTPWAVLEDVHEARVFELPIPYGDASETPFFVHQGESWALITQNALPVLRVNLRAKEAFLLDTVEIALHIDFPYGGLAQHAHDQYVGKNGDHFVAQSADEIHWRLDAGSGSVAPVDFSAALRSLKLGYCTPWASLARDGRVVLPLHDDESGGIFKEPRTGGDWTRLGMPFVGAAVARFEQHGESWLIGTEDGRNTYCPAWVGSGAEPPAGTLVGNSLQIVLPERGLTRTLPTDWSVAAVHESGLCVAFRDGSDLTLYDPITDASEVVLSSSDELQGWGMSSAFF